MLINNNKYIIMLINFMKMFNKANIIYNKYLNKKKNIFIYNNCNWKVELKKSLDEHQFI